MARESVWQRRARKCRSTKAEYYPKVDLTEIGREAGGGWTALARLDPPAAATPAAAPAQAEPEEAPPPPELFAPPVAAAPAAAPAQAEGTFPLPACLDLPAARPLVKALLERRGKPIALDGSSVHQLGAQCVQALLSARRTWAADGVALSLVNCAPRMIADLQLLGIDPTTLVSGEQP
jgi:chemotaxis protein CheX